MKPLHIGMRLTVAVFLLFSALIANAQNTRTISGTVVDEAGVPLEGVAVISNGKGAITDANGRYTLEGINGEAKLEFACIGFMPQVVTVSDGNIVANVTLSEDTMMLDETVVVGYGVQKKVNLTGAISTVSAKELSNRTSGSLTHMLQGAVPGLSVTTSSGNPSNEASINIRGVTSLSGGSPLVLIDGVEGDLAVVNPQDVESISVIKDASSAAIYGARACYGVVLVTTKNGASNEGKPVVRYSGHIGFSTPTTSTDYIDTGYWSVYITDLFSQGTYNTNATHYTESDMQELWARRNDKVENPNRPWVVIDNRAGVDSYIYYANTDWYHEMYTDFNPMQQHNFSVSGNTKNINYYFSGGYEHKQGTFKIRPDKYNKYNLRSKLDFKLNDWLDVSNNMSFYSSDYDYPGNASPDYTFCYGAVHGLASFPLKNPDGTYVYKTVLLDSNLTNGCHIELLNDTKKNVLKKYNFSNTAEVTAHVIEGLDIKANFTYNLNNYQKSNRWTNTAYSKYPGEILYDRSGRFQNLLEETNDYTYYQAANLYASYRHTFSEKHNLSAVAGINYEQEHYIHRYTSGRELSSDYISDFNLVQDKESWNVTGSQTTYAIAGAFGRVNYDISEKYLFEISGRFDGTSRFDAKHRWGFFPSASAGWKFSEEDFMSDVNWLNIGKLRFSYGVLGNQNVSNFAFIRKMNLGQIGYLFESDKQRGSGASVSSPNAGNLTWEEAHHYNLGLDISALDNRLTFTGEAYIRDTKGMLGAGKDLPAVYGAGAPQENAADLRSKGYELTLGWRDSFELFGKPLNYGITATLADYISVITKYQNPSRILGTYYEGMVLGEIWGFKTDGLFASDEEAAEYTSRVNQNYVAGNLNGGWRAGDIKYRDLNGDNVINLGSVTVDEPGDKAIIGNSNPRYQYGLTLTAQYSGFDFSIFFQGIGHLDWYPPTYCHAFWHNYNQASQTFVPKDWLSKVWSEDNPDAYFPRPRADIGNTGGTQITSVNDRYLQNLAYCRLKNLTIGYTIPEKVINNLPFSNVRVYFTGENLGYLSPLKKVTKYMDPEQAYTSAYLGFLYPWQKSFVFGVDITF